MSTASALLSESCFVEVGGLGSNNNYEETPVVSISGAPSQSAILHNISNNTNTAIVSVGGIFEFSTCRRFIVWYVQ
jgi:hypothetical protein